MSENTNSNSGGQQTTPSSGRGKGNYRGGRGGRFVRGNNSGRGNFSNKRESLNSDEAVPMLKYGPSGNYDLFKKKMITACLEKYKHLGRIIEEEAYYKPPDIDRNEFDLKDEFDKVRLLEKYKTRDKEIRKLEEDRPSLYAYIMSKISKESRDEVEQHADYITLNQAKDPLLLWVAIRETHQTTTTSKVETIIKKTSKDEYHKCRLMENWRLILPT